MNTDELIINKDMLHYMQKLSAHKNTSDNYTDDIFKNNVLENINKSVHNGNYYMLDKYGLIIRKNFQNSRKSAFGWKYNKNNEPINIHVSDILLQTSSNKIQEITLQQLKRQFPLLFNPPRGIIYKIYNAIYPDINLDEL